MAEFKIFRGIDVVVSRALGSKLCRVHTMLDVGQAVKLSDESMVIEVNLEESPAGVVAGLCQWKEVKVADRGTDAAGMTAPTEINVWSDLEKWGVPNGVTSIGPEWPKGAMLGTVYFENEYFLDNVEKIRHPEYVWPTWEYVIGVPIHPYQAMSIAYSNNAINDSKKGKHYLGFHARVHEVSGTLARVEIDTQAGKEAMWLDLGDASRCDLPDLGPSLPDFPGTVTLSPTPGSEGALFLEVAYLASISMTQMKRPIGEGY